MWNFCNVHTYPEMNSLVTGITNGFNCTVLAPGIRTWHQHQSNNYVAIPRYILEDEQSQALKIDWPLNLVSCNLEHGVVHKYP